MPCYIAFVLLGGCDASSDRKSEEKPKPAAPSAAPLDFVEAKAEESSISETPALRAQVLLDHLGFSPGVIDGFQTTNDLPATGKLDEATLAKLARWRDIPATHVVIIPDAFAAGPFFPDFPAGAAEQAKLPALGYRDLMEALAERFHTTPEAIVAMNSAATPVGAGKAIRVPNSKSGSRRRGRRRARLGRHAPAPRCGPRPAEGGEGGGRQIRRRAQGVRF